MRILLLSIGFRALGTWFSMSGPKLKFDAIAVRIEHVLSRRRCDVRRLTVLVEGGARLFWQDCEGMVELVLVAARYH